MADYTLSLTAQEIDNKLQHAILYTEQTLTEEQKAQVRVNLGIDEEDKEITVDNDFFYDGDNVSDAHFWITKADGGRVFVKVSDIPEDGIDLKGGIVSVSVPEYPNMNYTFTIKKDMFDEVSGLTQILYQNTAANDYMALAMVIVCTRVGDYEIILNGWSETLHFSETGLYFMDNRSYWGGKYVESLFIPSENDSEEIDDAPINHKGKEIQVFTRGLCIGDSITEGVFNYSTGQTPIKKYSYPSVLKRSTGIDIVNAGVGGLTSKTWYEASLNSHSQYGSWVNNEWVWNMSPEINGNNTVSTALDYTGFDFAIIHLGINDIYMMGTATLDDTISVFETNIYNIINKLKIENVGIKIFLCTIIPSYAYAGNTDYEVMNEKIREIASLTENVYLVDLNKYSECYVNTPYTNQHLTAIGYYKMAMEIITLISYIINQNLVDFKSVQFIGTDYNI